MKSASSPAKYAQTAIKTIVLMTTAFTQLQTRLHTEHHTWLITGVAGFIGSNLLEALLKLNQRVVGLA